MFCISLPLNYHFSNTVSFAEIPQYVPGASYRQLEFLLGRISNLTQQGDFTTQTGNYTGTGRFFKEKRNAISGESEIFPRDGSGNSDFTGLREREVRRTEGRPRKIEKLSNLRYMA